MKKILFPCLAFCLLFSLFFACSQEESLADIPLQKKEGLSWPQSHTNSIGMEFVLIPAGSFMMGCDRNFESCKNNETPQHRVTISKPFYLGKYEVTQAEWVSVMGNNRSEYKGRTNPVENVSWNDAQEFVRRLNRKEGTEKYRLPTEAEWEYAARAGSTTAYSYGDDARQLGSYAWYGGDSGTHPVGQLQPNPWGLYDMHGNVWEWVQDWYGKTYYANSPDTDPTGLGSGEYRVLRGGSGSGGARGCRSASRFISSPDSRYRLRGFRLAFSPGQ